MDIILVGGGVSNTLLAIDLKNKLKDQINVTILEKSEELLRKLTITGNGKCNILNKSFNDGLIINDKNIKEIINSYSYEDAKDFYENLGLPLIEKDNLVYPYSESSNNVRNYLIDLIKKLGINVKCNQFVTDYSYDNQSKKYIVNTNSSRFCSDFVVFATGGKSYSNLGADAKILEEFQNHKYQINDFKPALCALKVKENVKRLDGVRSKAKVSVTYKNKTVFSESGEVLFKKDGLSGIVIFNASLFITSNFNSLNDVIISINLLENIDDKDLLKFEKKLSSAEFLTNFVNKKYEYLIDFNKINSNRALINLLKNLEFHPKDYYGFETAQISYGGINLNNIKNSLESRLENNIYFAGELLNISGYCGGYNLSMCLVSALIISKDIVKKVRNCNEY